MQENINQAKTKVKKSGKRVILVLLFLAIIIILAFINIRGEYLQVLEIGEKHAQNYIHNLENTAKIALAVFVMLYLSIYITNKIIKKGLRPFFEDEKMQMPKLPNKSIALMLGVIITIFITPIVTEKLMLAINATWFGISDPIFNMDVGYYIFQKPFVELVLVGLILLTVALSIYTAVYYIIAFNVYLDGIDIEILKKNKVLKQLIMNAIVLSVLLGALTFIKAQDILFSSFISPNLDDSMTFTGAGFVDVTIKLWGIRILAVIIIVSVCLALFYLKKHDKRKTVISVMLVPIYLVILFVSIILYDILFVRTDELGREKQYINYNIQNTRKAYNIEIEEKEIQSTGTITALQVEKNKNILNNIPIVDKNTTLTTLKEYQSNVGYYSFNNTHIAEYNDSLVYVTPREISTTGILSATNKTYEYTHGYGTIITSAVRTKDGNIQYIQSDFNDNKEITEPRIYFGLETWESIITNAKNQKEHDYPITTIASANNIYDGDAGLQLGTLDRFILGISKRNINIAFGIDMKQDSKILTNRQIIERVKKVLPNLIYDDSPYLVITDEGKLVWVIDAYTTTNRYPYSTSISVEKNGVKTNLNYIRNSAKVLVDAYNGTTTFYITDRNDPIIMAYKKIYPDVFVDIDTSIPEDIRKHFVYPEFLYDVQSTILTSYHGVQPEVLYRNDDVWEVATYNQNVSSGTKVSKMAPYFSMVNDNGEKLGLILPYTQLNKKNISSYLVGTCEESGNGKLVLYKFASGNNVLGPLQLERQVEEDETISKELESIELTGTKIMKNILIIPVENTLLYVEPIYQVMVNESQVPVLKKIIVASGNKLAIGNNLQDALENLLSQEAVDIEVENTEDIESLVDLIIKANNNLKASNESTDWEMIGKDVKRLQELITQLEALVEEERIREEAQRENEAANVITDNTISNNTVNGNSIDTNMFQNVVNAIFN